MIKFTSEREFRIVRESFSAVKKINLADIGFKQISDSNLYIYQSDEYKVLNYSIKPQLIFSINSERDNIYVNLKSINIKHLPNIFKELKLTIEVKIFPEEDVFKINQELLSLNEPQIITKYKGLDPKRAKTIQAGILLAKEIISKYNVNSIKVSNSDILEGLILKKY